MRSKTGFTLIEILITVAIIGLLGLVGISFFSKAQTRARDGQRKSDLRQIKTALELYFNVFGYYPIDDGAGRIKGCKSGTTIPGGFTCMIRPCPCPWGQPWIDEPEDEITFMRKLPDDPRTGQDYYYRRLDNYNFCLRAILEITDDTSALESQTQCSGCTFPDAELEDYHYVACND